MAQTSLNSTGVASSGSLVLQTNGTTAAVTVDTSQNVGVGTASPLAKVDIKFATNKHALLTASAFYSNGADLLAVNDAGSEIALGLGGNPIQFYIGATERARIDSSGNLLVGTTSNSRAARLRVEGIETAQLTGYGNGFGIGVWMTPNASATGGTATAISFQNVSNTTVGSISTTGSATTYSTSSDYRLKENVQPMTGALVTVSSLRPVTYTWKADGSDGQGFIAHELQAVIPDAVVGEKDAVDVDGNPKYQGIDTSFLVATLTAAIQELKAEFDAYKATHP